jgi:hypothetical protein
VTPILRALSVGRHPWKADQADRSSRIDPTTDAATGPPNVAAGWKLERERRSDYASPQRARTPAEPSSLRPFPWVARLFARPASQYVRATPHLRGKRLRSAVAMISVSRGPSVGAWRQASARDTGERRPCPGSSHSFSGAELREFNRALESAQWAQARSLSNQLRRSSIQRTKKPAICSGLRGPHALQRAPRGSASRRDYSAARTRCGNASTTSVYECSISSASSSSGTVPSRKIVFQCFLFRWYPGPTAA